MSLFCGDKCKCKRRGKAYFSGLPELERGFGKACDSNSNLTREEYLCSGKYIDQVQAMAMYGLDLCPKDAVTFDIFADPTGSKQESNQDFKESQPIFIGLGVLIVAGLLILWLVNRK